MNQMFSNGDDSLSIVMVIGTPIVFVGAAFEAFREGRLISGTGNLAVGIASAPVCIVGALALSALSLHKRMKRKFRATKRG